ncbi:putative Amastin surface glycoprotein, partial [Leishmania naiffi]
LDDLWKVCPCRLRRLRACQASAIIFIFVYGSAAVLGFILLWGCSCLRWACLAHNVAGIATLGIVWASMVLVYYQGTVLCVREKDLSALGSGFALLVIAWCLNIINIAFLLLSWPAMQASENGEGKE